MPLSMKPPAIAAIALVIALPTSATAGDNQSGYYIAMAAAAIEASIDICPHNLWSKEDERKFVHKAAELLSAPDDDSVQGVVDHVADEIIAQSDKDESRDKFCQMMFDEKVKYMDQDAK